MAALPPPPMQAHALPCTPPAACHASSCPAAHSKLTPSGTTSHGHAVHETACHGTCRAAAMLLRRFASQGTSPMPSHEGPGLAKPTNVHAEPAPTRSAGQVKLQLLEVVAIHHCRARGAARHGVAQAALQHGGSKERAGGRLSGSGGGCRRRVQGRWWAVQWAAAWAAAVVTVLRVGRVGSTFRPLTSAVRNILTALAKLRARRAGSATGDQGSRQADACTTGRGLGWRALSFLPPPLPCWGKGGAALSVALRLRSTRSASGSSHLRALCARPTAAARYSALHGSQGQRGLHPRS